MLANPCMDLKDKGTHLAVYSNMPGVSGRVNATMSSQITLVPEEERYQVQDGTWTVKYEVNLCAKYDMQGGKSPPWIRWKYGDELHATKKEPDWEARALAAEKHGKKLLNLKIGGELPPRLKEKKTKARAQKRQRMAMEDSLAKEQQANLKRARNVGYALRSQAE